MTRRPRRLAEVERGARIRAARLARPLTLKAVSDRVGVSLQLVDQWEHGYGEPKDQDLTELAIVLGVSELFIKRGDPVIKERLDQLVIQHEAVREKQMAERTAERARQIAEARDLRHAAGEAARAEAHRFRRIAETTVCCICRKRQGAPIGSKFFCMPCWRGSE